MQARGTALCNDLTMKAEKQRHEAAVMEGLRDRISRLTSAELKRIRKLARQELREGLKSPLRKYTKNHFSKLLGPRTKRVVLTATCLALSLLHGILRV